MKQFFHRCATQLTTIFTPRMLLGIVLGAAIGSFGIYNIHAQSGVTEGGVIGLVLLLNHWTGRSPSLLSPILDGLAYAVAFRFFGKAFLAVSVVATLSVAAFFRLWEQFEPVFPSLSGHPLLAAILGGLFVGVGSGLVVRYGGAGAGDDALALTICKLTGLRVSLAYLATDLSVLLLSLSYIPLGRIVYSLITVSISSVVIDFVRNVNRVQAATDPAEDDRPANTPLKKP